MSLTASDPLAKLEAWNKIKESSVAADWLAAGITWDTRSAGADPLEGCIVFTGKPEPTSSLLDEEMVTLRSAIPTTSR